MENSDRSTVLNRKRNAMRSEDDEEDQHLVNLCRARRTDSQRVLNGYGLCVRCSKQCKLFGRCVEGRKRLLGSERRNVLKRRHITDLKRTLTVSPM